MAQMTGSSAPSRPSLPWRLTSQMVMGSVIALSRAFLYGLNQIEITGLDELLEALDKRRAPNGRSRGLITVCNHVGVLDDPVIWGILPMRYALDSKNLRWGLGAHDICFKNQFISTFFRLGQVLPTHRLWHSPHGGLYQPTMTQALKILSGPNSTRESEPQTFSTNGVDSHVAPAAFAANRNAWLHVFPEACCHQSPESTLRYFKWGVSRLILEADPAPDFIPMFVHGTQSIMPEDRSWPRFMPRIGNRIQFAIGERTNVGDLFGSQRTAWKQLTRGKDPETLRTDPEAVRLRIEVAEAVRVEIEKLRRSLGLPPEEDDTATLAKTWAKEPNKRRFKSSVDGSLINRH